MDRQELDRILRLHALWQIGDPKGEQANLQGAKLQYTNLQGASLRGINLQGANLQHTNLRYADLRGTDLQYANLHGANLQDAGLPKGLHRFLGKHEATTYPESLAYGCVRLTYEEWEAPGTIERLCQEHAPRAAEEHAAIIRALLTIARAAR